MEGFIDDILDTFRKNGRVEELRQIARLNQFKFKNRERFAVQNFLLKSFSIFKGKNDKRLKGVLKKEETELGAEIRVYDYVYFGEMKTYHTTVYEVLCQALDLPRFEIHPKGFLKKVTEFFLDKEKPYADHSNFYGKYDIQTENRNDFEAEISPVFLDHISDRKNISVEGEGDYLLVYFSHQKTPAREILTEYDYVLDLLEVILNDDSNKYV